MPYAGIEEGIIPPINLQVPKIQNVFFFKFFFRWIKYVTNSIELEKMVLGIHTRKPSNRYIIRWQLQNPICSWNGTNFWWVIRGYFVTQLNDVIKIHQPPIKLIPLKHCQLSYSVLGEKLWRRVLWKNRPEQHRVFKVFSRLYEGRQKVTVHNPPCKCTMKPHTIFFFSVCLVVL